MSVFFLSKAANILVVKRSFRPMTYAVMLLTLVLMTGVIFMTRAQTAPQPAAHPHEQALKTEDGAWQYTNALIDETSPYLLQHAHNPVDWYPWGDAAFDKARREDKPIFLSIGYSTCYWCHVMARKVFEDPKIAQQMNERFVNIKVDREQRPDVDEIYMTATQLMTGSGGWPMSVFLTPPGAKSEHQGEDEAGGGLKPYWAGTYIPPEPAHGMPGFAQVLEALSKAWHEQRQDVLDQADKVASAVREALSGKSEARPVTEQMVAQAAEHTLKTYDADNGGFGGSSGQGPKFPQPVNLLFLLAVDRNNPNQSIRDAVDHTLDRMARGGMYDQIGGGFHRYSTDPQWLVPHFEKMLYDNGLLAEAYAAALADADKPQTRRYERVLRGIGDYVLAEMTDPTGAFWSAQDAEVNAREGGNYIWTAEQVTQAIDDPDLAELALRMYGLDKGTNFQDPHVPEAEPANVLYLPRPLEQVAEDQGLALKELLARKRTIDQRLKAVRDKRDQPGTDDKVLTGWNGLMIAGLSRAGEVLGEPRYVEAAARAADAVLEHMSVGEGQAGDGQSHDGRTPVEGGLYRSMRDGQTAVPGFLEDYAFFIHGLLELHRAKAGDGPSEDRYLAAARRLAEIVEDQFSADGGGYYDTRAGQSDLFVRTRSKFDGALPTGNAVMIHDLIDLAQLTSERAYLVRAAGDLRSFAQPLDSQGLGMVHMEHAALRALEMDRPLLTKAQNQGEADNEVEAHDDANADEVGFPQSPRPTDDPAPSNPGKPVTAQATWTDHRRLQVRLTIDDQYHINAHEVTDEYLVPTQLSLEGAGELAVSYPEGQTRTYPFSDEPLRVYDGQITLDVDVKDLGDHASLTLAYQACTDRVCLRPQTLRIAVPEKGGG